MAGDLTKNECLLLDVLEAEGGGAYTLEELAAKLPELRWNELFHAVDLLSRRGAIQMSRRGFTYLLASAGRPADFALHA